MDISIQKKISLFNFLVNSALFLFVMEMFTLTSYTRKIMVLNLGWGNIYPMRLYTVGIFALLVIYGCYRERRFALPHLKLFLLLFFGFIIMENLPFRDGKSGYSFIEMLPFVGKLLGRPAPAYSFAKEQLYFYVYFLILINYGLRKEHFYRVINYSLIAGILVCTATYAGYLGLININTNITLLQAFCPVHELPRVKLFLINMNHISYACAFAILFLIIKQRNENKFTICYISRDILLILALVSITVIHSSLGAVAVALILVLYYPFMVWRGSSGISGKFVLIGVILSVLVLVAAGAFTLSRFGTKLCPICQKNERLENASKLASVAKEAPKPATVAEEAPKPAIVAEEAPKPATIAEEAPKPATVAEEAPKPIPPKNPFKISESRLVLRVKSYMKEKTIRHTNLMNTWLNFKEHPFVGVGFENAAKRKTLSGVTGNRSNTQFMQLLASSGIFFFFVYLCYLFRFFIYKIELLKRPEVFLSALMVIIHSALRRPMDIFPVFAYIAAYFYSCRSDAIVKYDKDHTGSE